MIEIAPLEQFLEESGEPHLIVDRAGNVVFATADAGFLFDIATGLDRFDAGDRMADLLAEWSAQGQRFGYTGAATLRAQNGVSAEMRLLGSTIDYRGKPHLLCRLCPIEAGSAPSEDLWSELVVAARESAFAAAGAMVEHELNQSLAAIVNYVQTSAVLLSGGANGTPLVRDALSEAGQQALHCAEMLRVLRKNFGFQSKSLDRHSLTAVIQRAHQLLVATRAGSTARLELRSDDPEVFVQLNHARFLSIILQLMQRCQSAASETPIRIDIESGANGQAIVRFLNCGAWDVEGAVPGKAPAELFPSDNDDVRLLAICQATMSLHAGYVSIGGDPGRNAEVRLILRKVKTGERHHA